MTFFNHLNLYQVIFTINIDFVSPFLLTSFMFLRTTGHFVIDLQIVYMFNIDIDIKYLYIITYLIYKYLISIYYMYIDIKYIIY